MNNNEINVIKQFEKYDFIKEKQPMAWKEVDEKLHLLYVTQKTSYTDIRKKYVGLLKKLIHTLENEIELLLKGREDIYNSLAKVNDAFDSIDIMNFIIFENYEQSEIPEIYLNIMNIKRKEKHKKEEFFSLKKRASDNILKYYDNKMNEFYYDLHRQKRAALIKQQYLKYVQESRMDYIDACHCCIEIDNQNTMNELSTKFRNARKNQGLTQQELSKRSGVCRTMIAQIESKNQPMKMETAIRLASCLNLQITVSDSMPVEMFWDKVQEEIIDHYKDKIDLSKTERKRLEKNAQTEQVNLNSLKGIAHV